MHRSVHRRLAPAAVLTAGALLLSGCGAGSADGDDGDVTLRFYWWGHDGRHENTQEIIDIYEEENPGVTIEPEYSDWSGYWDRLATQTAAGEAPDVIQMDALYLREYAENGTLLDLSAMDFSGLAAGVRDAGATDDGVWAMPHGMTVMTLAANDSMIADSGVELPDDTSWTWEGFSGYAAELAEATGEYGVSPLLESAGLQTWLRQHGKQVTTDAGELGFEPADAAEYFQFQRDLLAEGGYPPPSASAEEQPPGSAEQSMNGRGEAVMGTWWDTMIGGLSEYADSSFTPLRMPSTDGDGDHQMFFKPSMFYSGSSSTEHPEEVRDFIAFLATSEESAEINLTDRGMPAAEGALETIRDELTEQEKVLADYAAELDAEVGDPTPIPPEGASGFPDHIYRYSQEVLFERQTPQEAAEAMHAEMQTDLDQAG